MIDGFTKEVIRASAGTGKTFQLSNRFLGLLARGEPIDAILASTFTRKGAGEILDRVLERLAVAALEPDELAELRKFLPVDEFTQEEALALLRSLLKNLHRLRVGTLDGFFMQIAKSFSLELGIPPGWKIVDEVVYKAIQTRAISQLLARQGSTDALRMVHLLSGGQSKRTVASEIDTLVTDLYDTFLEAPPEAWGRLQLPPAMAGDLLPNDELLKTIDRIAAYKTEDKRIAGAIAKEMTRAREEDWPAFLGAGIAAKVAQCDTTYYRKPIPDDLVALYQRLVSHAWAKMRMSIAIQNEATRDMLSRFDGLFSLLKQTARAMRFTDITHTLAARELTEHLGDVAYRLDGRIRHLLLDEFQDTSPQQWLVLRPFARFTTDTAQATPTEPRSSFCVGDMKQAIYGWRGGVAEIFDAIDRDLEGLGKDNLDGSWRSSAVVIDTVNRVFSNIESNPIVESKYKAAGIEWQQRYKHHTTHRDKLPGYCRLLTAAEAGEGESQDVVTLRCAAARIKQIVTQAPGRSVGVLVRRNKSVARLIFELRRLGVPASEEGGNPLTDSPAVEAVLSLMRLADHPGDVASRFHVATGPLAKPLGLTDWRDESAAIELSRTIREQLLTDGYGATLDRIAPLLAPSLDRRDLGRLLQLVELGYLYHGETTARPIDFVRQVESRRIATPATADVRVMTIHQSKGLQFDAVVLPELDARFISGQTPVAVGRATPTSPIDCVCRRVSQKIQAYLPADIRNIFERQKQLQAEEALCLLYVAMTRAVCSLDMIIAPSKEKEKSVPSTAAGILRGALVEDDPSGRVEPRTELFVAGDPQWYEKLGPKEAREDETIELDVKLAPPDPSTRRGLRRQSPSGLEGGTTVDLADRLRSQGDDAMLRGTLVHAWFERIDWLEQGVPDRSAIERLTIGLLGRRHLRRTDPSVFFAMLEQPSIKSLLSRATYLSPGEDNAISRAVAGADRSSLELRVMNELPFAVRDGETITQGYIDRLVVLYQGGQPVAADIVDWKTDRVDPSDPAKLADRVDYYRPQIEAYRAAVSKLFQLKPDQMSARLAMLEIDRVVDV